VSDLPVPRVRTLGCVPYVSTWEAMRAFTERRDESTADELWLVEHPPVYTLGVAGRRIHLLRPVAIPVVDTDRGGQVTYHGPGQPIVYTLVDLRRLHIGVRGMVRAIEGAVIELLATYGIAAHGRVEAPGVYVRRAGSEAKVAALGLKIRRGCSYHGVALNVAMDLAPFADIDPCGYPGLAVTQLRDLGIDEPAAGVGERLAAALLNRLGLPPSNPEPSHREPPCPNPDPPRIPSSPTTGRA
jgi:lipoyl(octanoyl) transferase